MKTVVIPVSNKSITNAAEDSKYSCLQQSITITAESYEDSSYSCIQPVNHYYSWVWWRQ